MEPNDRNIKKKRIGKLNLTSIGEVGDIEGSLSFVNVDNRDATQQGAGAKLENDDANNQKYFIILILDAGSCSS